MRVVGVRVQEALDALDAALRPAERVAACEAGSAGVVHEDVEVQGGETVAEGGREVVVEGVAGDGGVRGDGVVGAEEEWGAEGGLGEMAWVAEADDAGDGVGVEDGEAFVVELVAGAEDGGVEGLSRGDELGVAVCPGGFGLGGWWVEEEGLRVPEQVAEDGQA